MENSKKPKTVTTFKKEKYDRTQFPINDFKIAYKKKRLESEMVTLMDTLKQTPLDFRLMEDAVWVDFIVTVQELYQKAESYNAIRDLESSILK